MAVEHSALPEAALHELKGASLAATNTVPIATGTGTTTFGFIGYSNITNRPVVLNPSAVSITPRTQYYSVVASSGLWSLAISGFTTVFSVIPVVVNVGNTIGTTAVATLATMSNTVATGAVVLLGASANTLGTTQTVMIQVVGV
ncbi:MAG: hypothetical protein ACRCVU_14060 [Flavobacterium sp.]